MTDWYRKEATKVVSLLATDAQAGLTEAEAQRRLAEHGPNELVERGLKSPWRILWEQLTGLDGRHPHRRRRRLRGAGRLEGRHRHPGHRRAQRRAGL